MAALVCSFCGDTSDVDVPEDYEFDLKWGCPCGGVNVKEGSGPEGVPAELRDTVDHLQPVAPAPAEAPADSEPEPQPAPED